MADDTTQLYLEDFSKGQIFSSPPRTLTEADVLGFAALTGDAHPLHYDDEYAKTTRFGRPIVHGLHRAGRRAACQPA
jgi:acyl dehydratase